MRQSPNTWRIIYSKPASGAWNMAVDESILESTGNLSEPTTLRFYAWEPACLSLGLAQPITDVDQSLLAAKGWHLVRRPTGGRAILHTDELTYSVCGSQDEPCLSGGVLESYREIARALLHAVELLGIAAVSDEKPGFSPGAVTAGSIHQHEKEEADPVCFVASSNYEITAGGKKLIGSAQARRAQSVLQHGSLPLFGDLRRIVEVLKFGSIAAKQASALRILERAVTVEQLLDRMMSWEEAAQAFRKGFEDTLGIVFQVGELSLGEINRAEELFNQKYNHPQWTERI